MWYSIHRLHIHITMNKYLITYKVKTGYGAYEKLYYTRATSSHQAYQIAVSNMVRLHLYADDTEIIISKK